MRTLIFSILASVAFWGCGGSNPLRTGSASSGGEAKSLDEVPTALPAYAGSVEGAKGSLPMPRASHASASAYAAAPSAASAGPSPEPGSEPARVVCAPKGAKIAKLYDVDWASWDGFIKGRPASCVGCKNPGDCCPSTELAGVTYGDLDGDGVAEGVVSYDEPGAMGGFYMTYANVVALRDGCVAYYEWPKPTWKIGSEGGVVQRDIVDGHVRVVIYYSDDPRNWQSRPERVVRVYYHIEQGRLRENASKREDLSPEQAGVYPVPTDHVISVEEIRSSAQLVEGQIKADKALKRVVEAVPAKAIAALRTYEPAIELKPFELRPTKGWELEGHRLLSLQGRTNSAVYDYWVVYDLGSGKLAAIKVTADKYYQLFADDPLLRAAVLQDARGML